MGASTLPAVSRLPGEVIAYAGATAPAGWLLCDGSLVSTTTYAALFAVCGHTYNRGTGNGGTGTLGSDPGSGNFYLPNVKGQIIVGIDTAQTEFDTRGEWGGSKSSTAPHTHDLSSHTHTFGTSSISDNTSDWPNVNYGGGVQWTTGWQGSTGHVHNFGACNAMATGGNAGLTPGGAQYGIGYATANTNGESGHFHGLEGHQHDLQNHTHTMKNHTHGGTTNGPGNNNTGASSAAATSGNLQPYISLNYIIKI